MEKDNKPGKKQKEAGGSMIIGLSLGVVFGIIFDNLPVWMCLGMGIGLLAPSFLKKKDNGGGEAWPCPTHRMADASGGGKDAADGDDWGRKTAVSDAFILN